MQECVVQVAGNNHVQAAPLVPLFEIIEKVLARFSSTSTFGTPFGGGSGRREQNNEGEKDQTDCSICLEFLLNGSGACPPCGHIFHLNCLEEHVVCQPSCPRCQDSCRPHQVKKLFF
jgi:Ring finger domain